MGKRVLRIGGQRVVAIEHLVAGLLRTGPRIAGELCSEHTVAPLREQP